jgi:hypothetical protein
MNRSSNVALDISVPPACKTAQFHCALFAMIKNYAKHYKSIVG